MTHVQPHGEDKGVLQRPRVYDRIDPLLATDTRSANAVHAVKDASRRSVHQYGGEWIGQVGQPPRMRWIFAGQPW